MLRVVGGAVDVGTRFLPRSRAVRGHKRWLMALPVRGELKVDAGAARALREGSSLFAVGLLRAGVGGTFAEREAVRVIDDDGAEIARGVVNYSSTQAASLAGLRSAQFAEVLGYNGPEELVHRHNICLLADAEPAAD